MKAILLAAGVGKRLGAMTGGRPKCLLKVGGQTLLSRHLEMLASLGIMNVVIVVGYREEYIRETVSSSSFPGTVRFVFNEQFARGSVTSLWKARDEIDDDIVLMDADVLSHPDILRRLVHSPFPNALLVDETVCQDTEECMVAVRNERVISLSKTLPEQYDFAGEGIGYLKVCKAGNATLIRSVQGSIDAGMLDMEYEDALKKFFEETVVGYELVGGLAWIEIDFPEDVRRAEEEILPAFSASVKQ